MNKEKPFNLPYQKDEIVFFDRIQMDLPTENKEKTDKEFVNFLVDRELKKKGTVTPEAREKIAETAASGIRPEETLAEKLKREREEDAEEMRRLYRR